MTMQKKGTVTLEGVLTLQSVTKIFIVEIGY